MSLIKKAGQAVGISTAVALVLGAIWMAYIGTSLLVQATVTAKLGVLTAAVAVATFIYNNNKQQIREIKARQFAEKRAAYQKFFDLLFKIFAAERSENPLTENDMIDSMHQITKNFMIWGSADTINQYNEFTRQSSNQNPDDHLKIFDNVERLMRSFRKDLGHNDRKLEKLGLSKLLLKAEEHHKIDRSNI